MPDHDFTLDAPLISQSSNTTSQAQETTELPVHHAPAAFIWALTIAASISGLLFGYDTGVISSTLVSVGSDLSQRHLTTFDKSLVTSSTSLFALVASPLAGLIADNLGRKRVIVIADTLFALGALWQAFTRTVWGMIFGRSIVGLAVGGASLVVPLYISELSPSTYRGRLVTLSILFITFGQMIAYIIGWWLSTTDHGWRWMVGLGAGPTVVQLGLLCYMPETPRWLMKSGNTEGARHALRKVYGRDDMATAEGVLRAIDMEILAEQQYQITNSPNKAHYHCLEKLQCQWGALYYNRGHRRALTIACLLQGLQQLCGFNSLMYFSATIFSRLGFTSPTLTSLTVAITNFIFTLVAMILIDRIGRRRILLLSIPVMILGLLFVATSFQFTRKPIHSSSTDIQPSTTSSDFWPTLILVSIIVYVSAYALGLGNVPWQQSELFPLSVRSMGSSIATATCWGGNFVVGLTFLPMMELLSPTWTFVAYALICMAGCGCIWKIYPETMGLGLEEVGDLLKDGWGVERRERLGGVDVDVDIDSLEDGNVA